MLLNNRRTLGLGSWDDINSNFHWDIPDAFSIHESCCDSLARADPNRTAIIDLNDAENRRIWTYGDLKDASDRLAAKLAGIGVGQGDRVAILMSQRAEVLVAHFAIMKLGAIALPLFTLFGEDALKYRLSDSGAIVAICEGASLAKLNAIAPDTSLRAVIATDIATGGMEGLRLFDWNTAMSAENQLELPRIGPEDPAVLIYTSGTTGSPKGALHAHRFLIGHLPSVEMVFEGFPKNGDVAWTPADWAWIGGLMDLAMPALYFGVPLVACRMRKFDADAAYQLLRDEGVTVSFLPPTALKLMRQVTVPEGLKLRAVSSGGESLGADLLEWGRDDLGAPINELYGQTECNLVVSSCAGLGVQKAGTMGRPVPGHQLTILDGAGNEMPRGENGEIAIRSPDPVMFLGYWSQPEKTKEKFAGDWLRTGDLGFQDDDGYVTYVSRDDDIITSAGYRIGPTEIENCLTGDPDVIMAAVVGLPDPVRTEAVTAFVVLRSDAQKDGLEDRLKDRVASRVSPHMAPREFRFVDSLPTTATGKVMRRALRDAG
ncbi:MAG: AMP-binding protein [Boseongicola sp.]|nr:AMP-binding protein [Boseongicola sp.]